MIWLTNTHMNTKGKPTKALFKFQDICKTSFHLKAAYNSMFQEVFQRPCWSHCGGSERANSLPAPTQPEKRSNNWDHVENYFMFKGCYPQPGYLPSTPAA